MQNGFDVIAWIIGIKLAETLDNESRMFLILSEDDRFSDVLATMDTDALLHERLKHVVDCGLIENPFIYFCWGDKVRRVLPRLLEIVLE